MHSKPHLVTTVLGSCVSVCLWDPIGRFGGINHYLLPLWNGEGLPTPKYGNIAIDKLIDQVRGRSTNPDKIIAKLFGGASMWEKADGLLAIGKRNIELAEGMLEQRKIRIISSDLGGNRGRKIIFNTEDGTVLMRRQKGMGTE